MVPAAGRFTQPNQLIRVLHHAVEQAGIATTGNIIPMLSIYPAMFIEQIRVAVQQMLQSKPKSNQVKFVLVIHPQELYHVPTSSRSSPVPCRSDHFTRECRASFSERLWDMKRIGDSAVSPDGAHVAYLVTQYDLGENRGTTSLLLQELPSLSTNTKALAFQSDLIRSEAKVLLSDVKGLHSLNWLNHSTGPKLVYIAPAEMEVPASEEGEETAEEDAEPETVEKPQAWLSPEGGDPVQLTSVKRESAI